jgi:TM2 domain-containing membrane protein YozV
MVLLFFNIYILSIIYSLVSSDVVKDCQVGNYCGSEKNACSIYGNCNFKIFDYFKENSTEEDKQPHCECNMGYSSYDIEKMSTENNILCCYEQKGQLAAFLLEMFIGFGVGHFYIGNIIFGAIKLCVQVFLCTLFWCVTYFACNREHSFKTNSNEINNNENLGKNILNENKNKNDNNDVIDENENENEDTNENKNNENNDTKNQSFELEENRENEIMFKNFIRCPKSMFVIYFAGISFYLIGITDIILLGFGVYKDGNGEELFMWY